VGAYRGGEAGQRPEFARAVAELNRLRALETVGVGPLPADELAELAQAYLNGPLDPMAGRLLFEHSEGNPFFAEELLRGWLEAEALVPGAPGWTLAHSAAPGLPPGILGAVRLRLGRLAPETLELLRAAAVIGRSFQVALL